MKKTICLFFSNDTTLLDWKRSGILVREINYYKKLIKKNYNLIILTYGDKKDKAIGLKFKNRIRIIPVYEKLIKPKNFLLRNLYNIVIPTLLLRKEKFQIIKVNQLSSGLSGLLASVFLNKKIYFRIGWEPNLLYKIVKSNMKSRVLYKFLSLIIYNFGKNFSVSSHEIKNYILKNTIFNSKKKYIKVVENFVDTNSFLKFKKKKFDRRVLLVSRLSKEKNIKFLIQALKETNIKADIIGAGTEKENLIKFAKKNKVKINFLGKKNNKDLPKYFNSYYVYVICSKNEGNVKSLLEAMSCQLICLGTNVNGIRNIIKNNKTGLIVNNPLDLRSKLNKIFDNINKYKFLGILSRKRVLKFNSINHFLNQEIKILSKLS